MIAMKDHEVAGLVNELTEIAVKFRDAQQLRERIAGIIRPLTGATMERPGCRKCGGEMRQGIALAPTWDCGDEGTCSPGGPGKLVGCAKCAACGWSVTGPVDDGPQPVTPFQQRVHPWLMACFGEQIAGDKVERNHRFLEEALELVQACGCTEDEARQLVAYVYGRPVGESIQEVGGVMMTLAALCLAQGLDMHACGETELTRVWTKVEQIRAKQAAKPRNSPLPAAPTQQEPTLAQVDAIRKAIETEMAPMIAQLQREHDGAMDERNEARQDLEAAQRRIAELEAKSIGPEPGFGLGSDQLDKLRTSGLKPEEIAADADAVRHARVSELVHWFARLAYGIANPKWLRGHAFELAYHVATNDVNRGIDLLAIERAAFIKGANLSQEERAMLERFGVVELQPESPAQPSEQPVKALIKERDAWRDEARSLQHQLHLSQRNLDLRRAHQERDAWYWQNDGEDHIGSMGNNMVVVIHASDLRALIAGGSQAQPTDGPVPPSMPNDEEVGRHFISSCDSAGIQYDGQSYEAGFLRGKAVGMDEADDKARQQPVAQVITSVPRLRSIVVQMIPGAECPPIGAQLYAAPQPPAKQGAELTNQAHDDIRYIQRVLESDAPKSDREKAAALARSLRLEMLRHQVHKEQGAELSDTQIDMATAHIFHQGRPTSRAYRIGVVRAALEAADRAARGGAK